MNSVQIYLK